VSLVSSAATDESLFPVRCCRINIPVESFTRYLSPELLVTFQAKAKEFGTLANARVYCHIATCSVFLGSAEEVKRNKHNSLRCDNCRIETCVDCRQRAHPNDTCQQNNATEQVRDFARSQGWQTCPQCQRIIELSVGCNHMTCHCGYRFCYMCAARWKTCGCEQWEEQRLYDTAEGRLRRELGEQAREQRPEQWRRQVHAFAEELRFNHECYPTHRWRGHGPGTCEECGSYMPIFLRVGHFLFSFISV